MSLAVQLRAWLALVPVLDDAVCLAAFGVGEATLQRIAAGEVEPEADVAARILSTLSGPSSLPVTHDGRPLAGASSYGRAGLFCDGRK